MFLRGEQECDPFSRKEDNLPWEETEEGSLRGKHNNAIEITMNYEKRILELEKRVRRLEMNHELAHVYAGIVADDVGNTFEWILDDVISDRVREMLDSYLLRRFGDAAFIQKTPGRIKIIIQNTKK